MMEGTPTGEAHAGLAPPTRTFRLPLHQVTSVVWITARETRVLSAGGDGNFAGFYRELLLHNLLFGWWSLFGLIWTPLALVRNRRAYATLRELISSGTADAGWYPDPTGHHQSRYWDGTQWSEHVRNTLVTSDPPAAPGHVAS